MWITAHHSDYPKTRWKNVQRQTVCLILPALSIRLTSAACTAYSRYILDIGQSEDWLALQMALAPCLIGYGAIAKRLYTEKSTVREGNRYWKWIENYVADDYTEAVQLGSGRSFP